MSSNVIKGKSKAAARLQFITVLVSVSASLAIASEASVSKTEALKKEERSKSNTQKQKQQQEQKSPSKKKPAVKQRVKSPVKDKSPTKHKSPVKDKSPAKDKSPGKQKSPVEKKTANESERMSHKRSQPPVEDKERRPQEVKEKRKTKDATSTSKKPASNPNPNESYRSRPEIDWLDSTNVESSEGIHEKRFSVFPIFRTPAPPEPHHLTQNRSILSVYPDVSEEYGTSTFNSHFALATYADDIVKKNVEYHCEHLRSMEPGDKRRKHYCDTVKKYVSSVVRDSGWKKVYYQMLEDAETEGIEPNQI